MNEYKKEFDEKSKQKLYPWPAADNPDWKWIIQWKAWEMSQDWARRANYCRPDNFGMYLYNDWEGYGLRELIENAVSWRSECARSALVDRRSSSIST
jgi:hypothetical protein